MVAATHQESSPSAGASAVEMALERLRIRLGFWRTPGHIDYVDVSHLWRESVLATRVSMIGGRPDPSRYWRRRLDMPQLDGPAALYEAVGASIGQQLHATDLPDWILVEGERPSLVAASDILRDCGVGQVQVASIARQRAPERGDEPEPPRAALARVFVAGRDEAVLLLGGTPELRVLEQLRDEAHRYAVQCGATVVRRVCVLGALNGIAGVGQTRRRRLLRHFESIERLQMATVDELARVPGIGRPTAIRIHEALFEHDGTEPARTALGA